MAKRLLPALFTFIVLISCYFAYDTMAVPMLHGPPAPPVEIVRPAESPSQLKADPFAGLVASIFPENSWERQCEIVLRNEQVMMFVGGYKQLDDHRLQMAPCTIVMRPQGLKTALGPKNRTWIMQAPDKTILQMERDSDVRRGSLGRIISAYIPGQVKLQCDESAPGAGDQVELVTTHLQVTPQQIWTPHDVRFQWGANFGMGTDLTIRFSDVQSGGGRFEKLPQAMPAGLRSIELVRLERLHVESMAPEGGLTALSPPSATMTDAVSANSPAFRDPVEVTCAGALKLDMYGGLARLNDKVKVERFLPGGQVDALDCEELTARFSYVNGTNSSSGGNASQAFQFERVVATGDPVVVTSSIADASSVRTPRHQFLSSRMEYDLKTNEFVSGRGKYATRIEKTGEVRATEVSQNAQGDKSEIVQVQWQKSMRWLPAESGNQLILDGPARCTFGENEITANRLKMWFDEQVAGAAPTTQRMALSPRRVTADGQVRIKTEQLQGATQKLDVILQRVAATTDDRRAHIAESESPLSAFDGMKLQPPTNSGRRASESFGRNTKMKRLQVSGELMRLIVESGDSNVQLRDLTIDGNVHCATIEESGEVGSAIALEGSSLSLRDLADQTGVATIEGTPARIRGRGMDISGPTINLDRAGNRVWIDGAGSATLPLPQSIARRYPSDAAFAYVVWQEGMIFDGQSIVCSRNVNVRGPSQMIRAQQLEVLLNRSIDFTQSRIQDSDVDLQRITASGGVTLENRTLTEKGLESIDSAAVETLSITYPAGEVIGTGPGWLESVRMGKSFAEPGKPGADSLVFLHVDFQRQMQASLARRQADFTDQIRAVYGPVRDWRDRVTASSAGALSEGQLLMSCDRLRLFQIPNRQAGKSPAELMAEGNVSVEGTQFAARAGRMSYDGKGLFVMEGQSRSPAHLSRQTRPGAARQEVSADGIRYWPLTGAVKLDGMKSLDFGQ